MLKEIKNSLKELGFNANEIKVYIALTQLGEASASQIAKKSDLPRTTTISLLERLGRDNYLTVHVYKGKTYYWIESPKVISDSLASKIEIAENLNKLLANLYRTQAHFPTVQVFDSKSAIKKFIEKILANTEKNSVFYTIDSPEEKNYSKIYIEEMEGIMLKQKRKKEIFTKSLIPSGSFKSIALYKLKNQDIEIREMPLAVKFNASLWVIGDMLVHFSGNPPFIASIKHENICRGIKSIYDFLWNISTPRN